METQGSFRNNTLKAIRGVMKNLVIQIIVSVSILRFMKPISKISFFEISSLKR